VVWNGLTPVFADITRGTYTLNPAAAAAAITPRTAAIMPVNVFGCPPDYEALAQVAQENRLPLVYDSAQGLGSRFRRPDGAWHYSGGCGEAEVFSLSPTKVVSAMEGGLITTLNGGLAQKLRQMRDYGKAIDGEDIAWLGLSARAPEINAIVARHNFAHVDELVARRQRIVRVYQDALKGLPGITFQAIPARYRSSYNYFTLFIDPAKTRCSRDKIYEFLKDLGIQAKKYFHPALHLQQVYRELGSAYQGKLPITEAAAAGGLALPLYSHITEGTVMQVVGALKGILRETAT
jgi:dTDP-4-amino-4,6-dideoxygalactose transaminase